MTARDKLLALAGRLDRAAVPRLSLGGSRSGEELKAAARAIRVLCDEHSIEDSIDGLRCGHGECRQRLPCPILERAAEGLPE